MPDRKGADPDVVLFGEIKVGDYQKFIEVLGSFEIPPVIGLASPGGNLLEAMKIGTLIRKLGLKTVAPSNTARFNHETAICIKPPEAILALKSKPKRGICNCASACFFVWVAGLERDGQLVEFHRPYFARPNVSDFSLEKFSNAYSSVENVIADYLNEMSLPKGWLNRVLSTPSSDSYKLSANEAYEFKTFMPASTEEWILAACTRLSPVERRERDILIRLRDTPKGLSDDEGRRLNEHFKKIRDFISCKRERLGSHRKKQWDRFLDNYPLSSRPLIYRIKDASEDLKAGVDAQAAIAAMERSLNLAIEWSNLMSELSESDDSKNFTKVADTFLRSLELIRSGSVKVSANDLNSAFLAFRGVPYPLPRVGLFPYKLWLLYPSLKYEDPWSARDALQHFIMQSERLGRSPDQYLPHAAKISEELLRLKKLDPLGRLVAYLFRIDSGETLGPNDPLDFDAMLASYQPRSGKKYEEELAEAIPAIREFFSVLFKFCTNLEKPIFSTCSKLFSAIEDRHENARFLTLVNAISKLANGDKLGSAKLFGKYRDSLPEESLVLRVFK